MWYALIIANLAQVALFAYKLNTLPPQVPLFYSKPQGEDQLADLWMIAVIPLLMNVLVVVNSYVYRKFFSGNVFARYTLISVNFLLIISLTFTFIKIILLIS